MNEKVSVKVDAKKWLSPLSHTWNYIGYDGCNYTHSPGGMELLSKFGKLEKPYYVRAHHMLCTGILHAFYKWGSTNVYIEDANGNPIYNYETIDMMVDIWLSNNLKPFFEIGFMPRDLADPREAKNGVSYELASLNSEYQRIGWAMPPKDYDKWYDLIYNLISHLRDKYGIDELNTWYFEMWNEPDIMYWRGTHEEFCKLYDYTEAAVHAAAPSVRFGGPATCGNMGENDPATVFLDGFLNHIKNEENYYSGKIGTRIDFMSFHSKGGIYRFNALAQKQLPSIKEFLTNIVTQSSIIKKYGYDNLECVLSEADPDGWAAGGRYDNFNLNFRNTEYYASYVMSAYKNMYDLAEKQNMDIRPLAWAFMFEAERCFEGTRTFSTQGINKAVFNLFKLFSKLGTQRISLETSRDLDPLTFADMNGTKEGPEVDGWATMDSDEKIEVLVYCHHDDWDLKETFDINLEIENLPKDSNVKITHYRIDEEHSNAYSEWVRQGRPNYPNEAQKQAILSRSGLEFNCEPYESKIENGKLSEKFTLPTHAISLLVIEKI